MTRSDWITHTIEGGAAAADLGHEWLLTNARGGYAMGTAAGRNNRRYHGLLVAATLPPVGRIVALNQVIDELDLAPAAGTVNPAYAGPTTHPLATLGFADQADPGRTVFSPAGCASIASFERGTTVAWTYRLGPVTLRKQVILHWNASAVTLCYDVAGLDDDHTARLRLRPLLTLRDFHAVTREHGGFTLDTHSGGGPVTARLGDVAVTVSCPGATWRDNPLWWYGLLYELDRERGQEHHEDAWAPGCFEIDVQEGRPVTLTAALGSAPADARLDVADREAHLAAIADRLASTGNDGDAVTRRCLAIASDDFVVRRVASDRELSTILAGYPWFADWGRDTFIALPGLMLCTGRHEEARDVLAAFASAIRHGLVPNRFDDYGGGDGEADAAHYNTVDASLWYVHAALEYLAAADDQESWRGWLADACVAIVDAYIAGTDHHIAMTGDALITAGDGESQLTWMDAACGGVTFTPRHGKAVEINALWHHALAGLAEALPETHRDKADHYGKLASRAKRSFLKVFWNESGGCLFDHVTPEGHADASIRPNQAFACSLARSPLAATRQKQVLAVVKDRLLTPVGLRTLPETDPAYHPRYTGDQMQRDAAYHRGTVWGWLIGPYAEGVLRSGKFSSKARDQAAAAIAPLLDRLTGEGLGQLHEIFEAQPDEHGHHRPVGCIAQAWSVAEVLRLRQMIHTA